MDNLLTISEAAKALGVTPSTLRRWDTSGKLPSAKTPTGHRRYSHESLKQFQTIGPQPVVPQTIEVKPSPQQQIAVINQALKALPPSAGQWTIPNVQQYVGIIQTISAFYQNPDEAYRNSKENARIMYHNLVIREPLQARLLASAELAGHVEPEDKKDQMQVGIAADLQRRIERIPNFLKYKYALLQAVWFGQYGVQNEYRWDFTGGKKGLKVHDWSPIHGDSILWKWNSPDVGIYVGVSGQFEGTRQLTTEPGYISRAHVLDDRREVKQLSLSERQAFVIHAHDQLAGDFLTPWTAGSVKGIGLRSTIYWTWLVLQEIVGWMVDFLERVGTGITLYKYIRNNAESYKAALQFAESTSNQAALLVPVDQDLNGGQPLEGIERIEPDSTGLTNMMTIADTYFGSQIRRLIVGQDATSRPVPSGMNSGVAAAHENTFARIVKYDAINLQETLTHQLVSVLQEWTWPGTTPCRYVLDVDQPNIKELMEAVKAAYEMGVSFDEDEVRAPTGMSKPDPDANILKKGGDGPPPMAGGVPGVPPVIPPVPGDDDPEPPGDDPEPPKRFEADFKEGDHPRDKSGQFGSGGGKSDTKKDDTKGDKKTSTEGTKKPSVSTTKGAEQTAEEAKKLRDEIEKLIPGRKEEIKKEKEARYTAAERYGFDPKKTLDQTATANVINKLNVDVGLAKPMKALEHKLEGVYKKGQDLAKAVAKEAGVDDHEIDRMGRLLGTTDTVSRWTANVPGLHTALELGAHALHATSGPVAAAAFLAAKAAFYLPVASLGYVMYHMGKSAVSGKNPLTLLSNANKRIKEEASKHPAKHEMSKSDQVQLAKEVGDWLATIPEDDQDEAEALLVAAIDKAKGDLAKALAMAKEAGIGPATFR